MRNPLIAAALAAIAATAVQAATVVGEVAEINPPMETVTLSDGKTFDFKGSDQGYCLSGFLPGDTVRIEYSDMNGVLKGRWIRDTKAFQTVGVIADVDAANNMLTLADGRVFSFDQMSTPTAKLQGFSAGDEVRIGYDPYVSSSGTITGLSIGNTASRELSGVVTAVNVGMGTVTLDDGVTYSFDGPGIGNCTVGGFLPGDEVILILRADGEGRTYEAILPN